MKLSKNFSAYEFDCRCGKCDVTGDQMNKGLIFKLQTIRDIANKPLPISSGIRCQAHNNNLPGSSPTSQHLTGNAADIIIQDSRLRYLVVRAGIKLNMCVGVSDNFIHLDTRPDGFMWTY